VTTGKSQLEGLKTVLAKLKKTAISKEATEMDMAIYIGACFSFVAGNASRPDVASNATLSEYRGWKEDFDRNGKHADFQVSWMIVIYSIDMICIKKLMFSTGLNLTWELICIQMFSL
jgi:hypothetical protein